MQVLKLKRLAAALAIGAGIATPSLAQSDVGTSPWGPDDELGRLNMMTSRSRQEIMSMASADKVYDLSVHFVADVHRVIDHGAMRRMGHPDLVVRIASGLPARHADEIFDGQIVDLVG